MPPFPTRIERIVHALSTQIPHRRETADGKAVQLAPEGAPNGSQAWKTQRWKRVEGRGGARTEQVA
ncbi:hypothetical protein HMPREF1023_00385 [Eggerthella sp. 1_3_56FAA]|nr:hypothetical protein HMPREF1023_00385 [Eggerthella sp. 1_3_56FAA]